MTITETKGAILWVGHGILGRKILIFDFQEGNIYFD